MQCMYLGQDTISIRMYVLRRSLLGMYAIQSDDQTNCRVRKANLEDISAMAYL